MLTPPLRILIVDDEPDRSLGWAQDIRGLLGTTIPTVEALEVEALDIGAARRLLEAVDNRRRNARERNLDPLDRNIQCDLDDVDILIVDYDLQELLQVGQWSTGLQVATLVRAFSRVKLVVLVNQFGSNTFDLTLTKASQSHSDFDVGSDQLLNPTLWSRSCISDYAPWAWNDGLLHAPARMEKTMEWVMKHLDKSILETLGFTTGPQNTGAETYLGQELWQECMDDPKYSYRDLVRESEFLTPKDRAALVGSDESCARVAAALISHWLERWVIPSNETLIDLPHLASSYPWLLTNNMDLLSWQATTYLDNGLSAFIPTVAKHEFKPGFPLARPVIWKHKILQDVELGEPTGFTYDSFPDVVFCEDTAQFHNFADTRPFSCRLPGSDTQRFVTDPAKIAPTGSSHSLKHVIYEPSVLFAL